MKFSISKKIFEKFPLLNVVIVVIRGLENRVRKNEVTVLLRQEEFYCHRIFQEIKVVEHPNIAPWKKFYADSVEDLEMCSLESLVKKVISGQKIPLVNKLVDIYNLVALKYLVSVGGADLDKVKGNIELKEVTGDAPNRGEINYFDDKNNVLSRHFNGQQNEKTKVTPATKNAILHIEGLPPVNDIEVKEAAQEIDKYVRDFCGGEVELFLVNRNYPYVNF